MTDLASALYASLAGVALSQRKGSAYDSSAPLPPPRGGGASVSPASSTGGWASPDGRDGEHSRSGSMEMSFDPLARYGRRNRASSLDGHMLMQGGPPAQLRQGALAAAREAQRKAMIPLPDAAMEPRSPPHVMVRSLSPLAPALRSPSPPHVTDSCSLFLLNSSFLPFCVHPLTPLLPLLRAFFLVPYHFVRILLTI